MRSISTAICVCAVTSLNSAPVWLTDERQIPAGQTNRWPMNITVARTHRIDRNGAIAVALEHFGVVCFSIFVVFFFLAFVNSLSKVIRRVMYAFEWVFCCILFSDWAVWSPNVCRKILWLPHTSYIQRPLQRRNINLVVDFWECVVPTPMPVRFHFYFFLRSLFSIITNNNNRLGARETPQMQHVRTVAANACEYTWKMYWNVSDEQIGNSNSNILLKSI